MLKRAVPMLAVRTVTSTPIGRIPNIRTKAQILANGLQRVGTA
jgi:hypothetical protein